MRSAAIIPFTPRQITLRRRPAPFAGTVYSLIEHRRRRRIRALVRDLPGMGPTAA